MGAGQIVMALADSVSVAIPGRMILGAGDAFVFSSVVRLLPSWFPAKQVPIVTQLIGLAGQVGQIVSALPFAWLLSARGWEIAFGAVSVVALVAAAAAFLTLRDRPAGMPPPTRPTKGMRSNLRDAFRHPGTQLGLWTHWTTCFAPMVFGMMWGFPYLTQGEGISKPVASLLLSLLAVVGALVGPVLGMLVQRHPLRRSNLVLAMVAAGLVPWLTVLLWPGRAPLWLLVVLCAGLAAGGPGSAIGFDFARTSNPGHRRVHRLRHRDATHRGRARPRVGLPALLPGRVPARHGGATSLVCRGHRLDVPRPGAGAPIARRGGGTSGPAVARGPAARVAGPHPGEGRARGVT